MKFYYYLLSYYIIICFIKNKFIKNKDNYNINKDIIKLRKLVEQNVIEIEMIGSGEKQFINLENIQQKYCIYINNSQCSNNNKYNFNQNNNNKINISFIKKDNNNHNYLIHVKICLKIFKI